MFRVIAAPSPGVAGSTPSREAQVTAAVRGHRLVALGETHRSIAFHGLLQSLLRRPAFICGFDDIVVEFGNSRFQSVADRFVAGGDVPKAEQQKIWRDTGQFMVWDSPLYEQVFDGVRALNQRRSCPHPVRILLGDSPVDWSKITLAADYEAYGERDQNFADVVGREVVAKGRRGLIIIGSAHILKGRPSEFKGRPTMAEIVERRHPGMLYSILPLSDAAMLTSAGFGDGPDVMLVRTSRLARASYATLASPKISVLIDNGGEKTWRPMNLLTWPRATTVVDALLRLSNEGELDPDPAIYRDPAYQVELRRRAAVLKDVYGVDLTSELDEALAAPGPPSPK